jgi:NTP pyrophosphatase (non-canonical NTP hydrolase)
VVIGMTDREIFETAINVFGVFNQENMAIEECAELIQAINKKHRGREHNLPEEIADVEIMLEQLKIANGCHEEVEEIRKQKVDRLYGNLIDECI